MIKNRKGRLSQAGYEEAKLHLQHVAAHEAGHYVVAEHFNLKPITYWDRIDPQEGGMSFQGCTTFSGKATAKQKAIIGWSGPLAEFSLENDWDDWEYVFCTAPEFVCSDDRNLIYAHPQRLMTCEAAIEILREKEKHLEQIANLLVKHRTYPVFKRQEEVRDYIQKW